jgi:hypothetical protein
MTRRSRQGSEREEGGHGRAAPFLASARLGPGWAAHARLPLERSDRRCVHTDSPIPGTGRAAIDAAYQSEECLRTIHSSKSKVGERVEGGLESS